MVKRKSPIKHKVRNHKREGKPVKSFVRGSGSPRKRPSKIVGKKVKTIKRWASRPELKILVNDYVKHGMGNIKDILELARVRDLNSLIEDFHVYPKGGRREDKTERLVRAIEEERSYFERLRKGEESINIPYLTKGLKRVQVHGNVPLEVWRIGYDFDKDRTALYYLGDADAAKLRWFLATHDLSPRADIRYAPLDEVKEILSRPEDVETLVEKGKIVGFKAIFIRPIPGRRSFIGTILVYPKEKVTEIEPIEKGRLGTPDKILLKGKSLKEAS